MTWLAATRRQGGWPLSTPWHWYSNMAFHIQPSGSDRELPRASPACWPRYQSALSLCEYRNKSWTIISVTSSEKVQTVWFGNVSAPLTWGFSLPCPLPVRTTFAPAQISTCNASIWSWGSPCNHYFHLSPLSDLSTSFGLSNGVPTTWSSDTQ